MYIGKIRPRANKEMTLLISVVFFCFIILMVLLLSGTYASKIDVTGHVFRGNTTVIYSDQSGIVNKINPEIGAFVSKGDVLYSITNSANLYGNESGASVVNEQIKRLNELIENETKIYNDFVSLKEGEVANKTSMLELVKNEVVELNKAIKDIRYSLNILNDKKNSHLNLLNSGSISESTYQDVLLTLQQKKSELSSYELNVINKNKEILAIELEIEQIKLALLDSQINYKRQMESSSQRLDALTKQNVYYVTAPHDGYFTFSDVHENQTVSQGMQLGSLTAQQDQGLYVKLSSDSQAMSYIHLDGEVVIRVDAYPYEDYGVLKGIITEISPTRFTDAEGEARFNIIVRLMPQERSSINIDWLADGMTVTGTYSGAKLSLIEWLFLPVVKGLKRNPDFWK